MLYNIACMIVLGLLTFPEVAPTRFCEGGHKCSVPKECCLQGCCYLYTPPGPPRSSAPSADHVLSLFFVNHWYFWCVVVALVLALLCACSLWRRRRALCGCRDWHSGGLGGGDERSEPDSVGSCYPPPQYSRCGSFRRAPPPYTEVTSKPDLYPLVFSYTGETGGKGGAASYLMVQYFRNYIVRPAGSLSATSTVDSLSSSLLCNANNEANTLIPPPYSRATSPAGMAGLTSRSTTRGVTPALLPRSASSALVARGDYNRVPPPLRTSGSANFRLPTMGNCRSDYSLTDNVSTHADYASSNRATYDDSRDSDNSLTRSERSVIAASLDEEADELRRSLDACCKILQRQQQHQAIAAPAPSGADSQDTQRSYGSATNNFTSEVSSLFQLSRMQNSPPHVTSPTMEVRDLLDKIKRLQEDTLTSNSTSGAGSSSMTTSEPLRRPSTFAHLRRKRCFDKSAKALYVPLHTAATPSYVRSTGRPGWLSRSAPATPGTIADASPLLAEPRDDGEML